MPAVRAGVYDSDFDSESVDTGSRDSLNNAPSHLALEYSLPVIPGEEKLAKSPASQLLVGVSHGVVENHQSGHMLGVVESGDNNHHYHLLDVRVEAFHLPSLPHCTGVESFFLFFFESTQVILYALNLGGFTSYPVIALKKTHP